MRPAPVIFGGSLLVATLATAMAYHPATTSSTTPGTPLAARPRIGLKRATPAEAATRRQLESLFGRYDLARWAFTKAVEIDEQAIPHSHPVLTLHARHLRDDDLLLATYIHEQSHWYFDRNESATSAAKASLETEFPDLPVGFPEGAVDRDSSYLHLGVIYFEYRGLIDLLGELRARQVMEFWGHDHYRALYRAVLDHDRQVGEILQRHGLLPP